MNATIVFDVNETLLDLASLDEHFEAVFGEPEVRGQWFSMLLRAGFVTTVLGRYHDFSSLGAAALEMVAEARKVRLTDDNSNRILAAMRHLAPHPDVSAALERLRAAGFRLAALTNSPPDAANEQLANAGLAGFFEAILSADAAKALKPAAAVYHSAAEALDVAPGAIWMVAAHDWDVAGALCAGCRAGFVARGKPYPALYPVPDITADDMAGMAEALLTDAAT